MRHCFKACLCVPLALLLGAAPDLTPDDLVRQGNAAFARQEYDAAVQLYSRAEEASINPGQVAFNKASALYRLGKYRDAQLHYLRCLDEADPAREPAVWYNLGNCLLQLAQTGNEMGLFREAIACYKRTLDSEDAAAPLRENARHNLELTKLLWLQARMTRPNQQENPNNPDPPPDNPPPPKTGPDQPKNDPGSDPSASPTPNPDEKKGKVDEKHGKQTPIETPKTAPGQGRIQQPPDDAKLKPLSPEDALKNLEEAARLIRRERADYMLRIAPSPARSVPDW
jgi:tetratricopeptide (TPR) repeat protein